MTANEIREELKEIKYYYERQCDLDIACTTIGNKAVKDLVKKYSEALKDAPAQIVDMYVNLYINGTTQEALADDLGVSIGFIKRRCVKLMQYLLSVL